MPSAVLRRRSRVVCSSAAAMLLLIGSAKTAAMATLDCRSIVKQNAYKYDGVCINDPIRIDEAHSIPLTISGKTCRTKDTDGTVLSSESLTDGKRRLTIHPEILGGNLVEVSRNRREARLTGGLVDYVFRCSPSSR